MFDAIVCGVLVLLGLMGTLSAGRAYHAWERQILLLGLAAHAGGAIAMVLLTVYFFGGGDMIQYHTLGNQYAGEIAQDPGLITELVQYTFRGHSDRFFLSGTSTGSMIGLNTLVLMLIGGGLYSACFFWGGACFGSQWLMYLALRPELPQRYHKLAMASLFFLPSFVFWTSGLLKEPVAVAGMGPVIWGISRFIHGQRSLRVWGAMGAGAVLIGLVKPYILFVVILSAGVWFYWWRSLSNTGQVGLLKRPVYVVLAIAVMLGGIIGMGVLFPEYSVETLPEQIVQRQYAGSLVEGGSNYSYGVADAPLAGEVSVTRLFVLAPMGLLFSLFRPLPFEIHNAAVLLNALEMMAIMLLWGRVLTVRPWWQTLRMLTMSPILMFCLSFVFVFGTIVGLSTTNVGTLSRYRIPMMPLYITLLLVLGKRLPVQLRAQLGQVRKRS